MKQLLNKDDMEYLKHMVETSLWIYKQTTLKPEKSKIKQFKDLAKKVDNTMELMKKK